MTQDGLDYDGEHLIYTTDLSHSFEPNEYRKVGYQKALSVTEKGLEITKTGSQHLTLEISKTTVKYYWFSLLDTSAITLIDFGKEFTNYQVESNALRPYEGGKNGSIYISYWQAREVYDEEWAIESLDIVLGLVGGFTGLLWTALAILLGGYE